MSELALYAILFLALLGHCLLAGKLYRLIHEDKAMGIKEKNDWKLKALVFPAFFWFAYQNDKKRRNSSL